MRKLLAAWPRVPAVVLDTSENEYELTAWADAGASLCLPRGHSLGDLIHALETLNTLRDCRCVRDSQAARSARAELDWGGTEPLAFCALGLTRRQAEVFELMARGLSNKQIARALSIEIATVKNHVHSILGRLELENRVEAIVLGQGLAESPRRVTRVG